jgi:hypothetical protein
MMFNNFDVNIEKELGGEEVFSNNENFHIVSS